MKNNTNQKDITKQKEEQKYSKKVYLHINLMHKLMNDEKLNKKEQLLLDSMTKSSNKKDKLKKGANRKAKSPKRVLS